jgi:uncharacterized protein (DUF1501 family)
MTQLNRRDCLRLGASTLLTCGTSVPAFLARSAALANVGSSRPAAGRVLVVVELNGGNDGLNTVVPYSDPEYRKNRPRLHLTRDRVRRIDDRVGFHPSLDGFAKLLESGRLAVVQSVGYPNPNRSHFESMAIWQAACLGARGDTPGWLARALDARRSPPGGDAAAVHVGPSPLPQALAGSTHHVPSLSSADQLVRRVGPAGVPDSTRQREALDAVAGFDCGGPGSLLQFVQRSVVSAQAGSARLEKALGHSAVGAGYPESFALARQLRLVARLVQAGLTTPLYYTRLGGFDTHANQPFAHESLLSEVGGSLRAFLDDLARSGDAARVAVLVYSEFGRRLRENASAGTDHGTAAPVFVLGGRVKAGLHGPYPDLQDLQDGDPKFAVDFRRVYATLLEDWLGLPSRPVLGAAFAKLQLLAT